MDFRAQGAGGRQVPPSAAKPDPCSTSDWVGFARRACPSLKLPGGSGTAAESGEVWAGAGGGVVGGCCPWARLSVCNRVLEGR